MDGSGFGKGVAAAGGDLKKLSGASDKTSKDFELMANHMAGAITRVRNEVLGLFALLTAGRGLKDMIADITNTDAATGRLASNLGLSTQELAAWEDAVQRAGGTAAGVAGSLQSLSDKITNFQTTGSGGEDWIPWLSRLNVQLRGADGKLKSVTEIAKDVAGSPQFQSLSPQQKTLYGQHLGFDQGTINFLAQGRPAVEKGLADSKALGMPNDQDAKNAQNLKNDLHDLQTAITDVGRAILNDLSPYIHATLKAMDDWLQKNRQWITDNIGEKIRELGDFLKAIDWKAVEAGILSFLTAASSASDAVGGWKTASEAMLALWIGSKFTSALSNVGALGAALLALGVTMGLDAVDPGGSSTNAFSDWIDRHVPFLGAIDDWGKRTFGSIFPGAGRSYGEQGGGGPGPTTAEQKGLSKQAIDYFKSQGWSTEQAAGIVGNLQQESSFNPLAGKGTAHQGLAQWSAERQADIEGHFKKSLMSMNYTEQLAAVQWELTEGKYKAVGSALHQANSARQAAAIVDHGYESPGNYLAEDHVRGANAEARQREYQGGGAAPPRDKAAPSGPSWLSQAWDWLKANNGTDGPAPSGPQTAHSLAHPSRYVPSASDRWGNATQNNSSVTHDNSSETHVNGPITIQTAATDSRGIAASLGTYLQDPLYTQSRRGLA